MHSVRWLPLAPILFLSGCAATTSKGEGPATVAIATPAPESAQTGPGGSAPTPVAGSFGDAWPGLLAQLQRGDAELLVEPKLGLVVLDNPGAFVTVTHHESYTAAVATLPRLPELGHCDLVAGELPHYSCEEEAYSTTGCVLTEPNSPRLRFWHDAFVRYALEPDAPVDPETRRQLARTEELATVTVTDTSRHIRWHFGILEGRWRLLVVDIVIPCSA